MWWKGHEVQIPDETCQHFNSTSVVDHTVGLVNMFMIMSPQ